MENGLRALFGEGNEADESFPEDAEGVRWVPLRKDGFSFGEPAFRAQAGELPRLGSVYASTTGDFFGTKNLGVNYGLLFTAWGVAGIIGPIIAGRLFDIFGNYTNAFYVGSGICVLALGSLLAAKRPVAPTVAAMEEVKEVSKAA